jgi:hypothetical protein
MELGAKGNGTKMMGGEEKQKSVGDSRERVRGESEGEEGEGREGNGESK